MALGRDDDRHRQGGEHPDDKAIEHEHSLIQSPCQDWTLLQDSQPQPPKKKTGPRLWLTVRLRCQPHQLIARCFGGDSNEPFGDKCIQQVLTRLAASPIVVFNSC